MLKRRPSFHLMEMIHENSHHFCCDTEITINIPTQAGQTGVLCYFFVNYQISYFSDVTHQIVFYLVRFNTKRCSKFRPVVLIPLSKERDYG